MSAGAPTPPIRVLLVDDSLTVRRRLASALARAPGFVVVGEAEGGRRAIELCARLRPDVITLDMILPDSSGLEVTEQIMASSPTPILVVAASSSGQEVGGSFEALAAGAVDVLDKPGLDDDGSWEARFVAAVRLVSRIKVITHPRARLRAPAEKPARVSDLPSLDGAPGGYRLVAIGASTGGPNAVVELLRGLPRSFPLPILLVIHLDSRFGSAFASFLDQTTGIRATLAEDGEALPLPREGARVIIARPDRHLVLGDGRLRLTSDPERHSCRPSVDVLFESIARELGRSAIGCLLTGMGRDGAEGLLAMRRAGAATFAQDEASSVVFGMPREAIRIGAAGSVVTLGALAGRLAALVE